MFRVRGCFRVQLKQRQILPGLPETYHPETGSRAHEKKACYVTQYRLNKACSKRFSRRICGRGKGFIPIPSKSAFYCVTDLPNCTHKKDGARWPYVAAASRSFFVLFNLALPDVDFDRSFFSRFCSFDQIVHLLPARIVA